MKLYWGWAFAWDVASVRLSEGPAKLELTATVAQSVPRQVDVIVLTTDPNYHPLIKERPFDRSTKSLGSIQENGIDRLRPLARRNLWQDFSANATVTNAKH